MNRPERAAPRDVGRLAWLASFVLWLGLLGCGPGFEALVRLAITAPSSLTLVDGEGGYFVELLEVDGSAVDGSRRVFVRYRPGQQEVLLEVTRDGFFGARDDREILLRVDAHLAEDDPVSQATGQVAVTLKRETEVDAAVTLLFDPRPIAGTFGVAVVSATAANRLNGRALQLQWSGSSSLAGMAVHVWWFDDGTPRWAGAFSGDEVGGARIFDTQLGARLLDRVGFEVALSLEASGLTPRAAPGGPILARGTPDAAALTALTPYIGPSGELADIYALLEPAISHASLAAGDALNGLMSARLHAEHVLLVLGGIAEYCVGATDDACSGGTVIGDLNASGAPDWLVASDKTGIDPGHVMPMLTALTTFGESTSERAAVFADAGSVASSLRASLASTTTYAHDLSTSITPANGTLLVDCVNEVLGDPYDPEAGAPTVRGVQQLVNRIESLGAFPLVIQAKGSP